MADEHAPNGPPRTVSVCTITYRRPEGLARLLASLARLRHPANVERVRVVVVDNDPDGSAEEIVERSGLPDVLYEIEPRRGIPSARNAALRLAMRDSKLACFIDDDEEADEQWLAELVRVLDSTGAEIVAGPVETTFPAGVPRWLADAPFVARAHRPDGSSLTHCFTNNVLMKSEAIGRCGLAFDEDLALTGGTDALFFHRANRMGLRIVWANGAVVREEMPASRANGRWILQRAFRVGASNAIINRRLRGPLAGSLRTLAIGSVRFVQGTVLFLPARLLGMAPMIGQLRYVWYGAGMLLGSLGVKWNEYRRHHGR